MLTGKRMPIQVNGELALSERRGERIILVRSIPWEMLADEHCERSCQRNHSGQTLDVLRDRGGIGACEAVKIIGGIGWTGADQKVEIPEAQAHRILYAMLVLFNRGQRVAEASPVSDVEVDTVSTMLLSGETLSTAKVRAALETAAPLRWPNPVKI